MSGQKTQRRNADVGTGKAVLCHTYEAEIPAGPWRRACDGTVLTRGEIDAERSSSGHPNGCTQCVVCFEVAEARGLIHGGGVQIARRWR